MSVKSVLIVGIAAAAALLLLHKEGGVVAGFFLPETDGTDTENVPYEAPGLLDQISAIFQGDDMETPISTQQQNLQAYLWMIRVSEGTAGPDGYRTLVGGSLFDSYADHPRILVALPNLGINSSAAGAYQILRKTWDGVRGKLGLPDFSPASQDSAAVELIRQRGALADVQSGRFSTAVEKCKKEWASLPGAGYGQHENALQKLQLAYTQAGGALA